MKKTLFAILSATLFVSACATIPTIACPDIPAWSAEEKKALAAELRKQVEQGVYPLSRRVSVEYWVLRQRLIEGASCPVQ